MSQTEGLIISKFMNNSGYNVVIIFHLIKIFYFSLR